MSGKALFYDASGKGFLLTLCPNPSIDKYLVSINQYYCPIKMPQSVGGGVTEALITQLENIATRVIINTKIAPNSNAVQSYIIMRLMHLLHHLFIRILE